MDYSMTGLAFEGLALALLRGLAYGLITLVLLWAAIEIARWGFRALKRRLTGRRPAAEHSSISLRLVGTRGIESASGLVPRLDSRSNDSKDMSLKEAA